MTDKLNWNNFDKVADLIEAQADKTEDSQKLKDVNEALGQMLDVTDNPVFQKMTTAQKNMFLQHVVDNHGKASSDTARKLLEGLHLRSPAPTGPRMAPAMTLAPPTPGMGGGGATRTATPQQPAYTTPDETESLPPWLKPAED